MGIKGDFSLPAERVIRSLNLIIEWRGRPETSRVDNGPEYISETLRVWAGGGCRRTADSFIINLGVEL
jgi:putative transposase